MSFYSTESESLPPGVVLMTYYKEGQIRNSVRGFAILALLYKEKN